jgi:PRTRC genetic system protein B
VFPENILAKSDRMIAWWTPAQRRQIFYQNSEAKAANLNGRLFSQPPLVWRVCDGQLKIRALTQNKRPEAKTKLAVAPYWNLSDCGTVCTGSMRRPENASVAAIPPGSGASTRAPLPMPMSVALRATKVDSRGFGAD